MNPRKALIVETNIRNALVQLGESLESLPEPKTAYFALHNYLLDDYALKKERTYPTLREQLKKRGRK